MTANRRIFWNFAATYGRSLYALVIGLFCGRWTLMALGEVDYGLMGVVGGLTAFISFFNSILSSSIGRFYAFSVGAAEKTGNEAKGLQECRRWFSVAISIHTIVPCFLMAVGYPIGVWAIEHYLTIPTDRVSDCVWVFRFVCVSCFLGMVSVPFNAMYTAKQYIAELTIYSFVTSTLNVIVLYYMVNHPGVWLVTFSLWTCLLTMLPSVIIMARAVFIFKECRIIRRHLFNWRDIRELIAFAGWNFFGALGGLLQGAGMSVVVNKILGPSNNAAMNIASTVSGQTQTLSGALKGAFIPAITSARGSENRERMVKLVHTTCKFGAALVLPFAIPLALEIDEVMVLWLKNPPAHAGILCIWMMAILVIENMTSGHWAVVAANGKIAWYQFTVGLLHVLSLPIAWIMMKLGFGLYSVGYACFIISSVVIFVRVVFVKILLKISPSYWIWRIFLPIILTIVASVLIGRIPAIYLPSSFVRVCLTTLVSEFVILPLVCFLIMDASERNFLKSKLRRAITR